MNHDFMTNSRQCARLFIATLVRAPVVLTLATGTALAASDSSWRAGADPLATTTLLAIRKSERALHNLRLRARWHFLVRAGAMKTWKPGGSYRLTLWLAGRHNVRMRANYVRHLMQWVGGRSPLRPMPESTFDFSWNGTVSETLFQKVRSRQHSSKNWIGSISGVRPTLSLMAMRDSSLTFTIYEFSAGRGGLFQYFRDGSRRIPVNATHRYIIKSQKLVYRGLNCVELTAGYAYMVGGQRRTNIWKLIVDPTRAYALLAANHAGGRRWDGQMEATHFQKFRGNVFLPRDVTSRISTGVKKHHHFRERAVFRATQIAANQPTIKRSIFKMKFPPGTVMLPDHGATPLKPRERK